jgi:exonuclease III
MVRAWTGQFKNQSLPPKLSTTNLADNFPWGDDLSLEKPDSCFCIYYQNVNRIKLDVKGGDLSSFMSTFDKLSCNVVGISKTKLDVTKFAVKKIINSTIQSKFKSSRHATSTSKIPFKTNHKPGCTMTLCLGNCVSRFHSKFEDTLGQWSTLSLNVCNGMVIHFITLYQVVKKAQNGPFTPYQQQRASLLLEGRDLAPRKAFLMDFDQYLLSLKPQSSQFVVMGDFYEVVGRTLSGFATLTGRYQLVDVIGHFHSLQNKVATYARGTKRLDYIFCSASLLPAVSKCVAAPHLTSISSWTIALSLWIGTKISYLDPNVHPFRVQPNNAFKPKVDQHKPNTLKNFTPIVRIIMFFKRLQLLHGNPFPSLSESIDRDFTQGMKTAESRCQNPGQDPWSPFLQEACLLVDIFCHALSMVQIRLESRFKLGQLLAKYAIPIDIPDDAPALSKALWDAQQKLCHIQKEAANARCSYLLKKACEDHMLQKSMSAKDAKRIAQAEAMKELHAKLRFILKDKMINSPA